MRIIRYLLFTFFVSTAIAGDLPKQVGTSAFSLALFDSHGLWGGQELFVLTNGVAYARVEHPPKKNESGLQEQRYQIQLSVDEVQALRRLLDEHRFLTLTVTNRTGVPDEAGATISLRLPAGRRRDVFQLERDSHPDFTAIYNQLLAIVRRAEKTKPVFQGASVYKWAPEGFDR